MHIQHFIFALIFAAGLCRAEDLKREALPLMEDLSRNCQDVKALTFPRPEGIDRELQTFISRASWIKRDLAKLREVDSSAERSNRVVLGKPFAPTLKEALRIISENETKSAADYAKRPDAEALKLLDEALNRATIGAKWLTNAKRYNAQYSNIEEAHRYYEELKRKAAAIDPLVLEYRGQELKGAEESFVKPFASLKQERENRVALAKQAAEAMEKAAMAKREQDAQEEANRKTALATAKGFAGYHNGIVALVDQLQAGVVSLAKAKAKLMFTNAEDSFTVSSASEDWIFYGLRRRTGEAAKIAVRRETERTYLQGSSLPEGMFQIIGTGRFWTVAGVENELLLVQEIRTKK